MVTASRNGHAKIDGLAPVTNDAEESLALGEPYRALIRIQGSAAMLFHRWSDEAVAAKSKAAKGSAAKKTDDVETYVYRMPNNEIGIPGEYLRMSIINAAKFRQDPRSPRKSAMDLFKAGIVCLDELASLGKTTWDYVDQRRVLVQRSAITRKRPAFNEGWSAQFQMQVLLPEYISPDLLLDVANQAGRLIGVGDFRPTYGRFQVTHFEVLGD